VEPENHTRQYCFRNRGGVYRKVFRNIIHQVVFCVLLSGSEERVEHEANSNATWHNQFASFRQMKLTYILR